MSNNGSQTTSKCCFYATGGIFCLHATMTPNASQLCEHLEITLLEFSWHSSGRNSLLPAVYLSLWLCEVCPLCLISEASNKLEQVVFHPSSDSSSIILLVLQFAADPLCWGLLISGYYNSSSCFLVGFFVISGWRERRRLVYGSKNKKMLCHLALGFKIWWHRGRDLNRESLCKTW